MSTSVVAEAVLRPIRDSDAEALGRVHAAAWHETYDHLISAAAFEKLSPRRMAELWNHLAARGADYTQFAALVDDEIVGFAGSGPARDDDAPRPRELHFLYLLDAYHGTGLGQRLFDSVVGERGVYLWVAEDNPRAHGFYRRNGFLADGSVQDQPFLGETLHEVRLVR